jgi:hypothetical protein
MTLDMTNNRVPYGLLTDEEKAALHEHEQAGGKVQYYQANTWFNCVPPWVHHRIYRTVPLPEKTQDVTEYEKGLNDALACIASLGYGRSDDVDHGHDEAFRAVAKYRDDWKAGATKKTQDVIAWERLPDWVQWVARDIDGKVFMYDAPPDLRGDEWVSRFAVQGPINDFPGLVQIGTVGWKDSKQRRPK